MTNLLSEKKRIGVRSTLDWRAYFRRFCDAHGGSPVSYKGRLLFADGWEYSATDYRGPEFPPPSKKEAEALSRRYWQMRLAVVNRCRRSLREQIEHLSALQNSFSGPLQVRTVVREGKEVRAESSDLDLRDSRLRLELLNADAEECQDKLKTLRE